MRARRISTRSLAPVAFLLGIAMPMITGCAAFRQGSDPTAEDLPYDSQTLSDSLEAAEELDYAGLEVLFPEIVQLEIVYREALQAVWNDDLALSEQRTATLDSVLSEVSEDENPLAAIYYQSLTARLERLKELVLEQRSLQRYFAKVDSLSVITPDGNVDSLALANLLEKPARQAPQQEGPRYDLALVENPLTDRWIRFFTGDGRHYMELWLSRLPRYEGTIYPILDEYGLPRDLIYLAMIESGLSMRAHSKANAVGPWQFIHGTGRIYGLKVDWWIDERRELEKATRAAAQHLSDLHDAFGSWPLAFAAYNCGPGRVTKAIARHKTRDFWRLSTLPSQTRNYVPKFMAALYVGKNPERYGMTIPPADAYAYDLVSVEDATDLRLIAELAEVPLDVVVDLNPHVRRWCTPPGERYDVKVPIGAGARCSERLAQVPPEERVTWRRHRVRKGETLSGIARSYTTPVQGIAAANKMKTTSKLHPGQYLLIPVLSVEEPGPRVAQYISDAAKSADANVASSRRSVSYKVRRGDTLSSIARKHGVSVKQVMSWNRKKSSRIYVGERLRLQVQSQAD